MQPWPREQETVLHEQHTQYVCCCLVCAWFLVPTKSGTSQGTDDLTGPSWAPPGPGGPPIPDGEFSSAGESSESETSGDSPIICEFDVNGKAKNVIALSHERGFSKSMTVQELVFWQIEQDLRVRTELTAAEFDQLTLLPSATPERIRNLSRFGLSSSRDELLAWIAHELPHIPKEYKQPGNILPIKTPLWTLCKGVLLAERKGEMETGHYASNHCHCIPRPSFALFGCLCQSRSLGSDETALPFLEVATCPTCSICIRCLKCPSQAFCLWLYMARGRSMANPQFSLLLPRFCRALKKASRASCECEPAGLHGSFEH